MDSSTDLRVPKVEKISRTWSSFTLRVRWPTCSRVVASVPARPLVCGWKHEFVSCQEECCAQSMCCSSSQPAVVTLAALGAAALSTSMASAAGCFASWGAAAPVSSSLGALALASFLGPPSFSALGGGGSSAALAALAFAFGGGEGLLQGKIGRIMTA
jgi:hypothetical protein